MCHDKDKRVLGSVADLRSRAEQLLKTKLPEPGFSEVESESLRLLHELQVHQIELEMQNAELLQTRNDMEIVLEKYTDLYDFAPVAYFTLDHFRTVRAANLTATSLLGIERPRLLGRSFDLFVVKEHQQLFSEFLVKVIASQSKESCEVMLATESNSQLYVHIEAIALGAAQEFRVAVIDITMRKQAEKEVHDLNAELEKRVEQRTQELQETQKQVLHAEKLSAIGRLSASIAHEFNNPLQGILSIMKGVQKRAVMEEEDAELLKAAIDESYRIKDLVRSLQDFNQPSSGKIAVMDMHKALDAILLLQNSDLRRKRISVVRNYAEGLPNLLAVPDQIKQVFLNLLANAADAADACLRRGGLITVSTWQEGDKVAVAIKDNGIGIKPKDMEQIFQPFYTTKPEIKGTGLGLSVSHGIVQKHHGEIRVESRPEGGATFTVLLPINGGEETSAAADMKVV